MREHLLKIFRQNRAIQAGHFLLTSGMHSDTYIQCARILERPLITAKLCRILVQPWVNKKVDVVASPAVGGVVLGYELARSLKVRSIFLERVTGKFDLRRGFRIKRGEKVLVAEDVITTGGSIKEVIKVIKRQGGKVLGVISLVDRSKKTKGDKKIFGVRLNVCFKLNPPLYASHQCPLCKKGIPINKPGSRGLR